MIPKCPGCQRREIHKMCPAWGTDFYMTGIPFTKEIEASLKPLKIWWIPRTYHEWSEDLSTIVVAESLEQARKLLKVKISQSCKTIQSIMGTMDLDMLLDSVEPLSIEPTCLFDLEER